MSLIGGTAAESTEETTVTARIIFGAHDGAAHPTICGRGYSGGGNIDISQPAPDTLVITMTGTVAACANPLKMSEATLDFRQGMQFAVEFSAPNGTGKLMMQAKVNGFVRAKGKQSIAGMTDATTTLSCGQGQIAVVPLTARVASCGDAFAVTASHGPVVVPICAGQFNLWQHFQIATAQPQGLLRCKSIAEFSAAELPDAWSVNPDPFDGANKEDLGYQVIIQVAPDPIPAGSTNTASASSLPPPFRIPTTLESSAVRLPAPKRRESRTLARSG
jgi:hypothetical protein